MKTMHRTRSASFLTLSGLAALGLGAVGACDSPSAPNLHADTAVRSDPRTAVRADLRTAESFAVLAGSTVTNTGTTTVHGDLGLSPGLAVTGFPPGIVSGGTIEAGDAVALQAQNDTTTAYNALAAQISTTDLTGKDLGGMTVTPGVYHFSSSAQLTGALTLDAQGDPSMVFVFQIGSTLTTASNSSVVVINGAQDCNVFWQVGSSATLGTTTVFKGDILALTSITLNTGATVSGHALARNAAVTLDENDVSIPTCTSGDAGASSDSSSASSTGSSSTSTSGTTTSSSMSSASSTEAIDAGSSSAATSSTATSAADAGVESGAGPVDSGVPQDSPVDAGRASGSPP